MKNNQQLSQVLDVGAINNLKQKVIKDYEQYIKRLFKGYKEDYKVILNEINFIDIYQDTDNQKLIYEYYMNYGL